MIKDLRYEGFAGKIGSLWIGGTLDYKEVEFCIAPAPIAWKPGYTFIALTSEMKTTPPGGGNTAQKTKGCIDTPNWTAQNPFHDDLIIFSPISLDGQKVTFSIVNMQGRIELEQEKFVSEPNVSINSSWLPMGNYILQVRTADYFQNIKIQKQ